MENELTHGSMFTGRGGIDEGAEDAGFRTIWTCENDKWCRNFLENKYQDKGVIHYDDAERMENAPTPTVISAGFPCQDTSLAGGGGQVGIYGKRTGLFFHVARVVNACRPSYILLENSPALLVRGLHEVLATLTSIGYDAQWECLRAWDFGYPHIRERLFVIAYPCRIGLQSSIFRPLETVPLHRSWTPTETYLRVSTVRSDAYRGITAIPRSDVVPGFDKEIKSIGNAVLPVIAEYLFQCIRMDIELRSTN